MQLPPSLQREQLPRGLLVSDHVGINTSIVQCDDNTKAYSQVLRRFDRGEVVPPGHGRTSGADPSGFLICQGQISPVWS